MKNSIKIMTAFRLEISLLKMIDKARQLSKDKNRTDFVESACRFYAFTLIHDAKIFKAEKTYEFN